MEKVEEKTKPCNACKGQGFGRSSVSKMLIKCPRCQGTGQVKNELYAKSA